MVSNSFLLLSQGGEKINPEWLEDGQLYLKMIDGNKFHLCYSPVPRG